MQLPCGVLLALGMIGLPACSEGVGPSSHPGFGVSEATTKSRSGTTAGGPLSGAAVTIRFAPSAPPLASYDTSFVVTVGKELKASVTFADGKTRFLRLVIPKDAEFFDAAGHRLQRGDTVRVTLLSDSVYASFQLGPHGSLFLGTKGPASMCLDYTFLDLGGQTPMNLSILYQPESGSTWTALATQLDVANKWACALIYHLSNYAIAY